MDPEYIEVVKSLVLRETGFHPEDSGFVRSLFLFDYVLLVRPKIGWIPALYEG